MSLAALTWAFEQRPSGSTTEKLLLLEVADHVRPTGIAFPFMETLAERTGVSVRTVHTNIKSLVSQGLLERVRVTRADGRQGGYLFRVPFPGAVAVVVEDLPTWAQDTDLPDPWLHPVQRKNLHEDEADHRKQTSGGPSEADFRSVSTHDGNHPLTPTRSDVEETDDGADFDDLWDAYSIMCKRRGARIGSKQEAVTQWRRLKPDERAEAVDAVARYEAVLEAQDRDGFTSPPKHAVRYLRHKVFASVDDELEALGVKPSADDRCPHCPQRLGEAHDERVCAVARQRGDAA